MIADKSFSTGNFSSALKTANVIPIFKKDDHTLRETIVLYHSCLIFQNYWKTYPRAPNHVFKCKLHILRKTGGFRYNHSTIHALFEITEKIKQACDSGQYACWVFLDLQKAFNIVNHNILLEKLNHYGIRGIFRGNKWFQSFLEDRKQFASVQVCHSAKQSVRFGVSQGSVLGPPPFVLFINVLHKAVKFSSVHHFTYDANLFLIDKSLRKMNKYINRDFNI